MNTRRMNSGKARCAGWGKTALSCTMALVLSTTLMVPNVAFAQGTVVTEVAGAPAAATVQTASPATTDGQATNAPTPATTEAPAETAAATPTESEAAATTEAPAATESSAANTAAAQTQSAATGADASVLKTASPSTGATVVADEHPTGELSTVADIAEQNALNESYAQAAAAKADCALSAQSTSAASTLPAKYDLRTDDAYDSSWATRYQNPWGCCWAFGNTASIESNILKQNGGKGASSLNLSELQLAWFAGVPVQKGTVIAGRTIDGDQDGEGVFSTLDMGGNADMAAEVLTSWEGLASETGSQGIPYIAQDGTISKLSDWSLKESQRGTNAVHVTDLDRLASPANPANPTLSEDGNYYVCDNAYNENGTTAIKNALMSNGAVSIAFHVDQGQYFDSAKGAQYIPNLIVANPAKTGVDQSKITSANHGVCIIGWDDSYDASNFTNKPAGNGAFLCRNSWGLYGDTVTTPVQLKNTKDGSTSANFPLAPYTDATGTARNVFVDSVGEFGPIDNMYLFDDNGTIDFGKPYATNVKLVDGASLSKVYQMSDGTQFTVTQTKAASGAGSSTWDGCFWLSYYDATIGAPVVYKAEVPDSSGKYSSNHLYEYDYLGMASMISTDEGAFDTKTASMQASGSTTANTVVAQCANVFTAVGNEALTAVSAVTKSAANTVEVFIYRLVSGAKSPTQSASGQPEITMTTTIDKAGYHTIHLTQPLYLHAGESFSVVERIVNQNGQGYVPLEMGSSPRAAEGGSMTFTARIGSGESYISTDGGKTWADVSALSLTYFADKYNAAAYTQSGMSLEAVGNAMIRAYTKDWTPEPAPTPAPATPAAAKTATVATASYTPAAAAAAQAELPKTADDTTDICVLLMLLVAAGMGTAIGARRAYLKR